MIHFEFLPSAAKLTVWLKRPGEPAFPQSDPGDRFGSEELQIIGRLISSNRILTAHFLTVAMLSAILLDSS
jgi:hypothetical protein